MKRFVFLLLFPIIAFPAYGTVNTNSLSATYTCTGSTGPFPFSFPISASPAMTVSVNSVLLSPSTYSVTPVNNNFNNGGSVTLNSPCTAGNTLLLQRSTPILQQKVFTDNMPNPMKQFEAGLDKNTEIEQELSNTLANSLCPAGQVIQSIVPLVCVTNGGGGGGGGSPFPPAYSIQATNSALTGTVSDPGVKINTALHSLDLSNAGSSSFATSFGVLSPQTSNLFFDTSTQGSLLKSINGSITVYPEWYGAVGDDTHDDTAAINAAWAACPASACNVALSGKYYKITGMIDMASSTSGVNKNNRSFTGSGGAVLDCQPTTTITACVRNLNGSANTISGFRIIANANPTYGLLITQAGASTEGVNISIPLITGAQYGIGLGPDTNGDVAHVNFFGTKVAGSFVADMVVGNGSQGNVLANHCYGCTFDVSVGDGVLIRGGGIDFIGGASDENTGTDFHVTAGPTQPLVISGWRSEGAAAFFKRDVSSANMSATLSGIVYGSSSLEADNCVITDNGLSGLSITNGLFTTLSATSNITFCITAPAQTFPVNVVFQNVGTNNLSFRSTLDKLSASNGVNFYSIGDFYKNPTTGSSGIAGTGMVYQTGTFAHAVTSTEAFISPYGVLGVSQNLAAYSEFDPSSIGTTWLNESCGANCVAPTSVTADTSDVTDPDGGNTAVKLVVPALASGQISGILQVLSPALTVGQPYTVKLCLRGAAGGESVEYGLQPNTGQDALVTLTTSWTCPTFTTTLASPTSQGAFFAVAGATSGATVYAAFIQVNNSPTASYYIHTLSSPITVDGAVLPKLLLSDLFNQPCLGTDATGVVGAGTCTGGGTGISGATAGQILIAGSATTATSSIAIGNTGTDIPRLSSGLLNASVIPNNAADTSGNAATATTATAATNLAGGALGSVPYQSAPDTTLFVSPNTTNTILCLTEQGTGSVGAAPVWGACSGSAATAFSAVTPGTNTGALVMGTGGSLDVSGTGTINANLVNGGVLPTSATIVGTDASKKIVDASSATLTNNTSGNAATATALAASPTNCSAGQAPRGINASGTAQNCTTYVQTICSGTITLSTGAIALSSTFDNTATCTGLLTSDNVKIDFASNPTAVTGYGVAGDTLTIYTYPSANTIHVVQGNNAHNSGAITPGAMTVNYHVFR